MDHAGNPNPNHRTPLYGSKGLRARDRDPASRPLDLDLDPPGPMPLSKPRVSFAPLDKRDALAQAIRETEILWLVKPV